MTWSFKDDDLNHENDYKKINMSAKQFSFPGWGGGEGRELKL